MVRKDPRTRGPAYPVKTKWKADVRAEMERRGMLQRDLAKKIGCAQGSLSEALGKEARHSSLVPFIHAVFGWAPPPDPEAPEVTPLSPDAVDLGRLFDRLTPEARQKLRDDAEFYLRLASVENKND